MKIKTIQHLNPIWGDKANFIIGIEIKDAFGDYDLVREQLWSKKVSDDLFIICCIPFLAQDLSLGDEVTVDSKYMVKEVVKRLNHYTYRIWFGDTKDPDTREALANELVKRGCLLEWYSNDLLAISCLRKDAQIIADLLFEKERKGLIKYETGKTL